MGKNIIDVKGYLRQRRLREAEEAGERIYRRFISNTLDIIYLEPDLKPCCANSWGIEVVHVGRPEGESEYDHQYCLGLSENLRINELFVGDRFGYEQTLDGTLHFRVIEFEDTDALRLVIARDHKRYDREVPSELRNSILKTAKSHNKLIEMPSFKSFLESLQKSDQQPEEQKDDLAWLTDVRKPDSK